MHIQRSITADATPHVSVSEPWALEGGEVVAPSIEVWPFGVGTGDFWSIPLPEARELLAALRAGVEQAEGLFGTGS